MVDYSFHAGLRVAGHDQRIRTPFNTGDAIMMARLVLA